jgi:hypothetical protein
VSSGLLNGVTRERSRDGAGRAWLRVSAAMVVVVALVVLTGCGKPAYCSDVSDLQNSVKDLPTAMSSGGVSALQSQIATIKSGAASVVDSAKSDFPSETSAMKSSVDSLSSAAEALPSSPSATQVAAIGADAAGVVTSVKSFADATNSKC